MGPLAGYLRVSHVGGRPADAFHSPAEQIAEIEAWAKARGYQVEVLPAELDAKGSDAARPIFRQAVEGVKSGRYAGVVVAYLSRAGRDLRLMLDLWDEVEAVGGAVYSARENIDASTPSGRLHRNLLASIAQHELEERREGFERSRRGAVERGIWQRRQTPRGYRRDRDTRRLVLDEDAESVRALFAGFLAAAAVSELARQVAMTSGGVRAILRNRVYLGELRVGRHVNTQAHEPLVDVETFEAAQTRLADAPRPSRGPSEPALLAGLVRCASCGHLMTRSRSKGVPIYACPARHSGEHCPAPCSITCARLDPHVEAIALAELRRIEVTATAATRGAAQRAVVEAEREFSAYLEAVDAAGIGSGDAAAGMRRRREAVEQAREALRVERGRAAVVPVIGRGGQAWADLDVHERSTLLRGLLSAVVISPVGRGRRVSVAQRTRVLRYGANVRLAGRGAGRAAGIVPIDDLDGIDVLGVPAGEDAL